MDETLCSGCERMIFWCDLLGPDFPIYEYYPPNCSDDERERLVREMIEYAQSIDEDPGMTVDDVLKDMDRDFKKWKGMSEKKICINCKLVRRFSYEKAFGHWYVCASNLQKVDWYSTCPEFE